MEAAQRLGVEVIPGVDIPGPLSDFWHVALPLDFNDPKAAAAQIAVFAGENPVSAIVSVDDGASEIAATAAALLGLAHNEPAAALAARDKLVMRRAFAAAGVRTPWFRAYPLSSNLAVIAAEVPFPCVVKPTRLSGSRGVIRANDTAELATAFQRVAAMMTAEGVDTNQGILLLEEYIPGVEVALEGLLTGGELTVLALFDKPDPLDGPYFEETIYVTPSRLPAAVQAAIFQATTAAAAAVGLRHGPIHAELRINETGIWPVELAGRSIGGLCSTILEFGAGMSLEELILRHAMGQDISAVQRAGDAAGVMMIPIPGKGILRCVDGVAEAAATPGVTGVEISARLNYPITPLPEGASYLGFIFARGDEPAMVEQALRDAHARLRIQIDTMIPLRRAI